MMDPEKNEKYSSFYLRRINRKMNWIMAVVVIVALVKVWDWLAPVAGWLWSLWFGGAA